MLKDPSSLKENKLFSWLCSCLPIVLIGVMQFFFYMAYLSWIFWEIMLIAVLSGVCIIGYSFWLGVRVLPKPTIKNLSVFVVVYTALVCFFYFGASAIDLAIKHNNLSAFILGAGTTDVILLLSFVYGWTISEKKGSRAALTATAALSCALIIVLSVFVSFLPKKEVEFNNNVVKNFKVLDTLPDGGGKNVKVILVNGQSNASGVSRVSCLTDEERGKYEKGFDNIYINYFCDNGFNTSNGAFVHGGLNQGYCNGFFGPELGLAETLSNVEGENFIILKYTWGGTILATQWFAPQSDGTEGPLYRAFINFTTTYMEYLKSKNYNAQIGAMCWMQGESDSIDESWTNNYLQNTKDFVAAFRRDLSDYAADDGIYYIDAAISDSQYWTRYERINAAKRSNVESDPKSLYVDTIAAKLDYKTEPADSPDLAHYDSHSEITLGHLFAEKVLERYNIAH